MTSTRFERMVIGLLQGTGSNPAIRAAADLAEFLNIELLGAFIADASLHSLIGLPGRELRMLDLQWQPVDLARISRDVEHVVDFARNRFVENVGKRSIRARFDIIAGAHVLNSLIRPDDIVVVIEPAHPGEKITQQFLGLLDAVFETAAAILVFPDRILRARGPIVATATSSDDPSITAALEIAAALRERLIIAAQPGVLPSAEFLADAKRLGVDVEQTTDDSTAVDAAAPVLSSSRPQGRLRVVSRSRRPDDVRELFSTLHGTPLLLVSAHGASSLPHELESQPGGRD